MGIFASVDLVAGAGICARLNVGKYLGAILRLIFGAILDVQMFRKFTKT